MRQRIPCRIILVCSLLVGSLPFADAAPPDPEFTAAKLVFMKEFRKKQPAARVAAVNTLAAVAQPDTAELLLKRGIGDDDQSVRLATRAGLKQLADDRGVRNYLMDEMKKAFRKTLPNDTNIEVFRALIMTSDDEQQTEILKSLEDYLMSARGNSLMPITVIDDLAVQGDEEALRVVKVLAKSKAFDVNFGYRRCVIQAMCQIRQPGAIDFLIEALPKTQGLIQHDVVEYLTRVTKQKFKDNDRDWAKWWKENQAEFEFPPVAAAAPRVRVTTDDTPTYYGIPICAKRIVFVLDTSGSMRGPPIDAAKLALLKAVDSLPEAVFFDVIMFDAQAQTWLPRLVPASKEAKMQASQIIVERGLKMGTASNEALNAAFELEPEAIYFLSDGEPTDGLPAQIVSSISKLNKTRRVSIHTIGVVTQRNGGIGLTMFMQPLANQNWGTFQLVE